ncbi:MAG: hypothetical protein MI824_04330 [Hyphomicrobiales bacterium]|nr:hypothetical protein [Hyphomicrobiales bacterium]
MCDYSLEVYRSRPAQEGESYETYRFASGSIGFIAPGDTAVAVCMASDTRLRLEGLPKSVQRFHGVAADTDATFIHLDSATYRDAVRFPNGAEVLLQVLGPGVKARVTDALLTPRKALETVGVL